MTKEQLRELSQWARTLGPVRREQVQKLIDIAVAGAAVIAHECVGAECMNECFFRGQLAETLREDEVDPL